MEVDDQWEESDTEEAEEAHSPGNKYGTRGKTADEVLEMLNSLT